MLRELVIFPDHYFPSEDKRYPLLIVGSDRGEIGRAVAQKIIERFSQNRKEKKYLSPQGKCHFRVIRLRLAGRQYFVVLEGFLVFDPPIQSRSQKQGSKALYYAAHKEEGLLLQYLPPRSQTSSHDHEIYEWREHYHLLAGEATLRTSEELKEDNLVTVAPEVIHQVLTTDQPSLTLIEIKGDPNWFDKWLTGEGHTFKPLPPAPWEKHLS